LRGQTIAGNDNLFVELIKIIEDIEKLFLRLFFADDELKIVNNKTVEFLEFTVEIFTFAVSD